MPYSGGLCQYQVSFILLLLLPVSSVALSTQELTTRLLNIIMSDLYEKMIRRFLQPLSVLPIGVGDAYYFLRKDDAFVFTEGYIHPPGGLMGKVMLSPNPDGDTNIFGRKYMSSYKRVVDGKLILIPHPEQMIQQFELTPGLDPNAPRPVYEEYHVEFPLSDFKGVFEHHHSLLTAMEIYPAIRKSIEDLSRSFEVPLSRLGCTGSTCYGKFKEPDDDVDLVWYGSIAENKKVLERIKELTRNPRNRVFEFGRWWPIRFYWKEMMICSFFNYRLEEEIPLRDCRMEVLEENVKGVGMVDDDTHNIYMPSIVRLTHLLLNGKRSGDLELIIYDGSLRGEFFAGDYLEFLARRVRVQTADREFEALLVNLGENIKKED